MKFDFTAHTGEKGVFVETNKTMARGLVDIVVANRMTVIAHVNEKTGEIHSMFGHNHGPVRPARGYVEFAGTLSVAV